MPFKEYTVRELAEPLRQGDIFRWQGVEDTPWYRFGLIVTADCDLSHKKYGNVLSYCPILPFQDFLELFWIPDDFQRTENKYIKKITEQLSKVRKENKPEYTEYISPNVLLGWIYRRGIDGLLDDIGEKVGKRRISLHNDLQSLSDMKNLSGMDIKDQLLLLARISLMNQKATEAEVLQNARKIWEKCTQKISSLPGDLFFINELSDNYKDGYVVYLRRVSEIKPSDIAVSQIMVQQSRAIRISQLRSTFRYRLTQKLAAVFADIGLPEEYEDLCSITVNSFGDNLNIFNK